MLALRTMRILAAKMSSFFVGLTPKACFQIDTSIASLDPLIPPISEVFETGKAALALNPRLAFGFTSAAHAVTPPKLKPWAMREGFVVPAIRSRDVACGEWPNIRRFEHFL
jgi:hypothetical protein